MRAPLYDPTIRRKRNGHYPWLKMLPLSALAKRDELTFAQKRAELDDLIARGQWAREKIAA